MTRMMVNEVIDGKPVPDCAPSSNWPAMVDHNIRCGLLGGHRLVRAEFLFGTITYCERFHSNLHQWVKARARPVDDSGQDEADGAACRAMATALAAAR